jgi:uncharacterized Zn finger protein
MTQLPSRTSPAQRRAEREAEYKKNERNRKRRRAYWLKFVADRPARCNECGTVKTAKDMVDYARREVSVKNRCWQCFEKEMDIDYGEEPRFAGDSIWWKTRP